MILEQQQPEWLDLRSLQQYACVSERTLREWIHRAVDPLPAARVGCKMLVRRSVFDRWLERHQVKHVDVGCIVDQLLSGVKG
jgi:excisionase family DNA binding protein